MEAGALSEQTCGMLQRANQMRNEVYSLDSRRQRRLRLVFLWSMKKMELAF